jgi:aminoglycoside phosphotransferase (APT) family kinase protein
VTDIELGAKLAEGACAEVYEWGADGAKIVKLAKPNTNRFALEREQRLSDIAWRLGLQVPRAHGLVQVDGRDGIVFERAAGDTILKRFAAYADAATPERYAAHPEADILHARTTARLLFDIHSQTADGVPPQHASLERDIRRNPHLSATQKDAVMAWLDGLPAKRQLCHGDPNPGNILLDGETASIIDWNNATLGNPEADLAEYVLMIRYASLPSGTPPAVARLFEAARAPSIRLFLDEYERLSGLGFTDIEPWLVPIAARKLAVDGITEAETQQLIAEVERGIPTARL